MIEIVAAVKANRKTTALFTFNAYHRTKPEGQIQSRLNHWINAFVHIPFQHPFRLGPQI
jgi:hypothetical protein